MVNLSLALSIGDLFEKIKQDSIPLSLLIVSLLTAALVGLFIFFVYKLSFSQTAYSYTFNLSLILMVLITTSIILTSSNVVLTLSMVGTLSVARFRSNLKDPIDIVYILWATSAGLAIGATQYLVAIVGSLVIGGVILALSFFKLTVKTFIIVANYPRSIDGEVMDTIKQRSIKLKSKIIHQGAIELTIEVNKHHEKVMEALEEIHDLENLSLVLFED